jgi:glycosyltransferase involved in cell wall biosynthesis
MNSANGRRPTVLYVCHNHPSVRPGGAEGYALELHRAMKQSGDFDAVFLAKGGPPLSTAGQPHLGTYVAPVGGVPDEYFMYTDGYEFDWLLGSMKYNKDLYTKHFREFLLAVRPDVVHFQHTMFLGYDMLRIVRDTLPQAPILYTLHEFMSICHRQGQMVRTVDEQPCLEESPRRCHECFPDVSRQAFFLRKLFVRSQFALVDQFIAPSRFLMERYLDWGIPPERIRFEEYGRRPMAGGGGDAPRERRDRIGFFGQLARLRVHGANLDLQPGGFQNTIRELLDETRDAVTFVGRYEPSDIGRLMEAVDWVVIPSVWWENSPLVIQEAFAHGRPVIASDIGGMAEKVTDGVDGIHFRAGDPDDLAETIRAAVSTPGLWERLRAGIGEVYPMATHVRELGSLYTALMERRTMEVAA